MNQWEDVPGYDGNLDINHFFGDEKTWMAYVGKTIEEPKNETHTLEDDDYKVTIERK